MISWGQVECVEKQDRIAQERYLHQCAWQLLYKMLKELYDIKVSEADFSRTAYGKPYLRKWPQLHFNMTHAQAMVACAISQTEIGIDIEAIRNFNVACMKKVCTSEEEQKVLKAADQKEAFWRLWTLKESYIKAVGKGLSMGMQSISFKLDEPIVSSVRGYEFKQKKLDNGYVLSWCEKKGEII